MVPPSTQVATLERHPRDGWVRADPWSMSPGLLAATRGVVAALCPPASCGAPTDDQTIDAVTLQLRLTLPYMSPLAARGIVLLMYLFDWSPIWRLRGWRRLRHWDVEPASAHLDLLAASRLFGTLVQAARAAILTAYFDRPEVHAAIDYDPRGFMRQRIAARSNALSDGPAVPLLKPSAVALASAVSPSAEPADLP
ncbi:MAG: hypothetical protein KC502_21240 [Myxococcales bacterium]|nr:hypothetical protein [Myxococcales bacterium]